MGCLKLDISDNHFTILEVVHNSLSVNKNSSADAYLFGFQGQEKDNEISGTTGGHTTAMFWEYDTRLGRRWNIDPVLKEWESPYAAFAGNPIWFVDPFGDNADVFITGPKAEKATKQLNESTSLEISRDSKGQVHAKGEAVTKDDKLLLESINNPDIKVNVHVGGSNYDNKTFQGGGFFGSTVTEREKSVSYESNLPWLSNTLTESYNYVETKQFVNPYELAILDFIHGSEGQAMLHEVTESYIAGKISQVKGAAGPAIKGGSTYKSHYIPAHNDATPQPGDGVIGECFFRDAKMAIKTMFDNVDLAIKFMK